MTVNIYTKQGSLLLSRNSILNHHCLELLEQHGIDLWIEDTQLATELNIEDAVREVQEIYENIRNNSQQLSNRLIQRKLMPKIQELCYTNNLSHVIIELSRKDNYTYRHCIGVALISFLIGKWMGIKNEQLSDLTIAAVLHDLGKIKIADEVLNKSSRLNNEEYEEMKLHTQLGYNLIRNLPGATEEQALVALQHHEREDGSGYPFGIRGYDMSHYSKIVAVADVFHAMISKRIYKNPTPLFRVFHEIQQQAFELFDPAVVHCFILNVMSHMIGDSVMLSDGQVAKIIMLHPDDLINPLVMSQGQYYDLRQYKHKIVALH